MSDLEEQDEEAEEEEEEEEDEEDEQRIESQSWTYPRGLAPAQGTRRAESIQPTTASIRVDLEKFERGLPWRLEKQ